MGEAVEIPVADNSPGIDEPELAHVLAEILATLGFRCDLTSTGREALRLLCDPRMPDMDGRALYGWLEQNRAHLCRRTAFVTGDALSRAAGDFLARSGRPVLEKPFAPREARRLVAALAAGGPSDR